MTKFAHRVTNVEEIPRLVSYAFRAADTGIKGPVLLDVPIDVLFSPPQEHRIAYGSLAAPIVSAPAPDPHALESLLKAWRVAQRPVVITGTGASGAGKLLTKLAETTRTPVYYSNKYSSDMPHDHKLRGGPATGLAVLAAGGKQGPDFVLLLGARTGFLLAGRSGAVIPKECVLAQIDLDGTEIGRSLPVQIGIVADATKTIQALLSMASNTTFSHNDEWIESCAKFKSTSETFASSAKQNDHGEIHPWHAMDQVMRSVPHDSIVVIDGGDAGQWASLNLEKARPHLAMVASGYLGFLGNGWGYSIGAAVADPDQLVINIHGDGSAGFHIQELDTMARFDLKILTIIQNNNVWGISVNGQDIIYNKTSTKRPATQLSSKCRYEMVAQGFGCNGKKVVDHAQIASAVNDLAGKTPSLLNLMVSVKPASPATVSMVGMEEDDGVIVVPYYDNVPRPFYKERRAER